MTKITHKDYCLLLLQKRRTVTPLEVYQGANDNIKHQCDVCFWGSKGEWSPRPSKIKNGQGCPRCSIKKKSLDKRITHKDYCLFLLQNKRTITPLEVYKGAKDNIKHQCDVCGHGSDGEWSPIPSHIKNGQGCPKCACGGPVRFTHKDYCLFLLQNKRTITPLEVYKRAKDSIKHQCDVCSWGSKGEWSPKPSHIKKGSGCPKCAQYTNAQIKYGGKPTWLYYIKIENQQTTQEPQYKIGVVRRYKNHKTVLDSVKKRYSSEFKAGIKIEVINEEFNEDGYQLWKLEQTIKDGFSNHRINKDDQILNSGWTETFTKNVLK